MTLYLLLYACVSPPLPPPPPYFLKAEELAVAAVPSSSDSEGSEGSFKVFSRYHSHQLYLIETRSAKSREDWVKRIRLLSMQARLIQEESLDQQVWEGREGVGWQVWERAWGGWCERGGESSTFDRRER